LNPLVILKTEQEVEQFLGLNSDSSPEDVWEGDYNTTLLRQLKGTGKIPDIGDHWK